MQNLSTGTMSHRILLVDDEIDILEFVRYNLLKEGYEVFTAQNGAEALKAAAECRPHLILLDMMMPVMDGAQTCRAIRQDPQLRDTMVVFLSALGEEDQQLTGFGVGADDYLTKPIKMKLLVSRVQAILKRIDAETAPAEPAAAGIAVDREHYTVTRDGHEIALPRKEFALLDLLYSAREAFLARRDIYEDLGHRGGRGRPHHRRAHPQTAPEDRRRTHRHHQGRGLQIRTLSRAIPGE